MKIFFSPEYSGAVYIKSADGADVMMDTTVVNTIGLINMLELRMGLHYANMPEHERIANYFNAMCLYMKANPHNVMEPSFKISGLSTAKAMLAWRDELRSADWNFDGSEISERLKVIIGVEEYFRKHEKCDLVSRLHAVVNQMEQQKLDCKDMEIVLQCDIALLSPCVSNLLLALEGRGATLSAAVKAAEDANNLSKIRLAIAKGKSDEIKLDADDESLLVWQFADERSANEYLAFKGLADVDVWVNADNKQMDNWLELMNKPLTGSVCNDCSPQLTQLFMMGVGLFAEPLNVNTLIEWMNMPVHPIDSFFRNRLANAIVAEGGYRNDKCKSLIERFIAGEFVYLTDDEKMLPEEEQKKIRNKEQKKRKELVSIFLPPLVSQGAAKTEKLKAFAMNLSSWARVKVKQMLEKGENLLWVEQLMAVASMCEAFSIMLNTIDSEEVDYKTIDSWISTIYTKASFTNAIAERGSRLVVDSPAKIASPVKKTIWIGVEGDNAHTQQCAFLYPTEKETLTEKHYIDIWSEQSENAYREQMMMTPLIMTQKQLILVVCERRGGEPTLKHPLIVRLEQMLGKQYDSIVRHPHLEKEEMRKVNMVSHDEHDDVIHFEHADKIQWPNHFSPTNIGTLAEYPFDYMMKFLLGINADGKAQMTNEKAAMGNVAHAVIESLFSPRGGKRYSKPEEVAKRIDEEYDSVYYNVLEAKGAILQLAENKLSEKLLHEQLKTCLDVLLDILKENDLKVTGCEQYVEDDMMLGLPKAHDDEGSEMTRDVLGYIDMTLEDKDGHPVVFDFKWTSSRSYYQNVLQANRSVQLEFYRHLLGRKTKDTVGKVAYFLMPAAQLYSKEEFKGRHCRRIDAENADNIVQQLRNAVLYRKQQIDSGMVEVDGVYEELQYVKDTESKKLFPLIEEGGKKKENIFSDYGLFK